MPYLDDLIAAYTDRIRERPDVALNDPREMLALASTASERGELLAAVAWELVRASDISSRTSPPTTPSTPFRRPKATRRVRQDP